MLGGERVQKGLVVRPGTGKERTLINSDPSNMQARKACLHWENYIGGCG